MGCTQCKFTKNRHDSSSEEVPFEYFEALNWFKKQHQIKPIPKDQDHILDQDHKYENDEDKDLENEKYDHDISKTMFSCSLECFPKDSSVEVHSTEVHSTEGHSTAVYSTTKRPIYNADIPNHQMHLKFVMIGDTNVGKTCVIARYYKDEFNPFFVATVGIDFRTAMLNLDDVFIRTQCWDSAGLEKFRAQTLLFFKGSSGFMLLYDITDTETFDSISNWMVLISEHTPRDVSVVLVGNKSDLEGERQVTREKGQALADRYKIPFVETSAKAGINVSFAFSLLHGQMFRNFLIRDYATKHHASLTLFKGRLEHPAFEPPKDLVPNPVPVENGKQISRMHPISPMQTELSNKKDGRLIFISHYKEEAATEALFMKDRLLQLLKEFYEISDQDIFVDVHDLNDLKLLDEEVNACVNLVFLLTRQVLNRAWCIAELVQAHRSCKKIIPVEIQGSAARAFDRSNLLAFMTNYGTAPGVDQSCLSLLQEKNIHIEEVESVITQQIFEKIALPLNTSSRSNALKGQFQDIIEAFELPGKKP